MTVIIRRRPIASCNPAAVKQERMIEATAKRLYPGFRAWIHSDMHDTLRDSHCHPKCQRGQALHETKDSMFFAASALVGAF